MAKSGWFRIWVLLAAGYFIFIGLWALSNVPKPYIVVNLLARDPLAGVTALDFELADPVERAKWEKMIDDSKIREQKPSEEYFFELLRHFGIAFLYWAIPLLSLYVGVHVIQKSFKWVADGFSKND